MYKNKFSKIFESNFQRFQGGGVLAGDLVKIKDGIMTSEWLNDQASNVKSQLEDILGSDLNLRVSSVHAKRPAVQGSVQQDQQADDFYCDITQELAPGLFHNVITIPVGMLDIVDTDGNLSPIPDSQRYDDNVHIKPEEVDLPEGQDETCPVFDTQIKKGDKKLTDKDTPGMGSAGQDNMTTAVYMR